MALVVRASGGGSGGVRLIFSALLRRLLGMRSRRIATSSPSGSPSSDEDDDTSPLINQIPRNISSVSNFLSLDGRDSGSAHMAGAMPLPFGHPDWPAHELFDARTARPESAKQDVEMVTSTRQVTRLLREHEHVMPPVALVNTTPGQPPILRIPLTDRLVASFLAQAVGVQVDATDGVNMTANRAVIPPSSDSKGGPTQLMKVFRGLLLAHVFFALPLIVIFFPRYDKEPKNVLLSLFDRKEVSDEKMIVLAFFVIHASLGSLGVLIAHIADGPVCTGIVGSLTLWIIISVVGFIDYIFLKTLPDEGIYKIVFLVHFIVMLLVICGLWAKFVGFSWCCSSKQDQSEGLPS